MFPVYSRSLQAKMLRLFTEGREKNQQIDEARTFLWELNKLNPRKFNQIY